MADLNRYEAALSSNDTEHEATTAVESGGRQFDTKGNVLTSSSGAIGRKQVMPTTAPEAAKLAGVPYNKYLFEAVPEYNDQLGDAYFDKKLEENKGDVPKAHAAYNAGQGTVQAAEKKAAASGKDWTDYLPKETQGYLKKIEEWRHPTPKAASPNRYLQALDESPIDPTSTPSADPSSNRYLAALGPTTKTPPAAKQSVWETGGSHFVAGVPQAAGGLAAADALTSFTAPWAIALAPETLGLSLLAVPIISGIVGYTAGSYAAGKAEHALLPEVVNKYLEVGAQQNKHSAFAGDLLSFGIGGVAVPKTLVHAAVSSAVGTGFTGLQQIADGKLDVTELAMSAVMFPFFGKGAKEAGTKDSALGNKFKEMSTNKQTAEELLGTSKSLYVPSGVKGIKVIDIRKESDADYMARHGETSIDVDEHKNERFLNQGPVRRVLTPAAEKAFKEGTELPPMNERYHIEVDSEKLKKAFEAGYADTQYDLPEGTFKSEQAYLDFSIHRAALEHEMSPEQFLKEHPQWDVEASYDAREDWYTRNLFYEAEMDELMNRSGGIMNSKSPHWDEFNERKQELDDRKAEGPPPPVVRNKGNLSAKEVHSVLLGSKNMGEAIDRMVAGGFGNNHMRSLLERLQGNKYLADGRLVLDAEESDTEMGSYNLKGHRVTLRGQAQLRTFVHEAFHAVTANAYEAAKSARLPIASKFDAFLKGLQETADPKELYTDTNKKMQALGLYGNERSALYGLSSVHEMISEGFTKKEFIEFLKEKSILGIDTKPTNAWDAFKNAIKELIKFKGKAESDSAFDQLMDLSEELVEEDTVRHAEGWSRNPELTHFNSEESVDYNSWINNAAMEQSRVNPFFNVDDLNMGHAIDDIAYSQVYDDIIKRSSKENLDNMRKYVEGITDSISDSDRPIFDKFVKPLLDTRRAGLEYLMKKGVIPTVPLDSKNFPRRRLKMSHEAQSSYAEAMKKAGVDMDEGFYSKFKNYFKELAGGDMSDFNADMERRRGSTEERSVFMVEKPDGSRQAVQITKKGALLNWNDKKPTFMGMHTDERLTVGDHLWGGVVKEGKIEELEQHTFFEYNKDALAVLLHSNAEIREQIRAHEGLERLKESPLFKTMASPPGETIPHNDWRVPKYIDKVPGLRGYAFPPKMAEVIEDFAKMNEPSLLTNISNILIKCMMLNPIAHIFNESMHLYNARGLSGWVTPQGLHRFATTGKEAMNSVLQQDQFYKDTMALNGSLMDPVGHSAYQDALHSKGVKEFGKTLEFKQLAASLGRAPGELLNAISKKSNTAMWTTRNMMYIQYIKELMQTKGLSHAEAIQHAEKHMPNYRLPTHVGEKMLGAAASRGLSNVLQNPNMSVFSRYHYGMIKSLIETAKDVKSGDKSKMKEGLDTTAAIVVAMSVLYPMMDMMAAELTGNKDAKQRRAGPYHPINAIMEVANSTKDPQAVLSSVFTFNPALQALVELAIDRKAYSGMQVYNPQSAPDVIAKDVGKYLLEQNPLLGQAMKAEEDKGGPGEGWAVALARQADIVTKSPIKEAKDVQHVNKLKKKGLKHTIKSRMGLE